MTAIENIATIYGKGAEAVERAFAAWLPALLARFTFLAVLYPYYLQSAMTKVGPGLSGFFMPMPNAYYQIVLPAVEAAGGDVDAVAFFPWGLIVRLGIYAEFLLPLLIVLGLFTRVAALGMIGFILVQSFVDLTVLGVDTATAGMLFDRFPDGAIYDQRLLWIELLAVLVILGGGRISLDAALGRLTAPRAQRR